MAKGNSPLFSGIPTENSETFHYIRLYIKCMKTVTNQPDIG